jgi:group I intron endonuclease
MPYKRIIGIYQIQSTTHPERIYIGSSISIKDRWRMHKLDMREGRHDNFKLQRHYNKYGLDDLVFSIIEQFDIISRDFIIDREQYYLDTMNPWFNIAKFAEHPAIGRKLSQEQIENLCIINTGRKDSPETTRRRSESHKGLYGVNNGRKFSEEVNRANSERNSGERNGFFGKHHTQESIDKIKKTKLKNRELYGKQKSWNKGLTKETSDKLRNIGIKISNILRGREGKSKGRKRVIIGGKIRYIKSDENININSI